MVRCFEGLGATLAFATGSLRAGCAGEEGGGMARSVAAGPEEGQGCAG